MTTQEQIESFYRYATHQISRGECEKSVDDLFEEWRIAHPTSEEIAETVAAVQVAIDNMNNGAPCRDAKEALRDIREKLNMPTPS